MLDPDEPHRRQRDYFVVRLRSSQRKPLAEAAALRGCERDTLVCRLMEAIIEDNLIDAILDDEHEKR